LNVRTHSVQVSGKSLNWSFNVKVEGVLEFEFGPALSRFLGSLPARPRLLGLGEPTHGFEEFLEIRNRMFRWLVEHEGYRGIAMETDVLAAQAVDAFVAGGPGDIDVIMSTGFSHGFGAAAANRELVAWMRAHNAGREPAERLRFDGVDAPLETTSAASPRGPLVALRDYLTAHVDTDLVPSAAAEIERLAGDDVRWTATEAVMDPARSAGDSPDARALRLIADDLAAVLDAETPGLVAATSEAHWRRARLHARTAIGLLRYHRVLADPAENRIARAAALRDAMMADNLRDIADRESRRGPTLLFAHNGHLQREPTSMTMAGVPLRWWCAGAIIATVLGDGYAFLATALGSAPSRGLGEPAPDTLEGLLAELGDGIHRAEDLKGRRSALRATDYWYAALHPEHLVGADAVLFVPTVSVRFDPVSSLEASRSPR
jgi:erythromycin esterase-like protein